MAFVIELDNYQGPFDVLLDLLKKRRLDITELSLGTITNDYLEYISSVEMNLEDMSHFLAVATKLALDKSSALLFIDQPEDDSGIEESLRRYVEIKKLAQKLKSLLQRPMLSSNKKYIISIPTKDIDIRTLADTHSELMKSFQSKPTSRVMKSQKHKIDNIRRNFIDSLSALKKINLDDLSNSANKTEAIVKLLTLLELLKQGKVIRSNEAFVLSGAVL